MALDLCQWYVMWNEKINIDDGPRGIQNTDINNSTLRMREMRSEYNSASELNAYMNVI